MLRNHKRTSKFDPIFLPESCEIVGRSTNGRFLTVERKGDWRIFKRHPDDVKIFHRFPDTVDGGNIMSKEAENMMWHKHFEQCKPNVDGSYEESNQDAADNQESNVASPEQSQEEENQGDNADMSVVDTSGLPRRSQRLRRANPRYEDYVTTLAWYG